MKKCINWMTFKNRGGKCCVLNRESLFRAVTYSTECPSCIHWLWTPVIHNMTGEGCVASVQWNAATDQYKWRRKIISCMQLHSSRATCASNVTHMTTCPCISDVSCRQRWLTVGSSSGWCRCWRTMMHSPTTRWSTPSLCWWTCACVHQVGKISSKHKKVQTNAYLF